MALGAESTVPVPASVPVSAKEAVQSVPAKSVQASVQIPVDAPVEVATPAKSVASMNSSESPVVVEQKVEQSQPASVAENVQIQNSSVADATKAETSKQPPKKKFSFRPLKKVGPIRLVNGFRSSKLRPRIALDSQKDVADNVREWLYERRNKYEKFVDNVLGKASPISAKQPAPGANSSAEDSANSAIAAGGVGVGAPATPLAVQYDTSGK